MNQLTKNIIIALIILSVVVIAIFASGYLFGRERNVICISSDEVQALCDKKGISLKDCKVPKPYRVKK